MTPYAVSILTLSRHNFLCSVTMAAPIARKCLYTYIRVAFERRSNVMTGSRAIKDCACPSLATEQRCIYNHIDDLCFGTVVNLGLMGLRVIGYGSVLICLLLPLR